MTITAKKTHEDVIRNFLIGNKDRHGNLVSKDHGLFLHGNLIADHNLGEIRLYDGGFPSKLTSTMLRLVILLANLEDKTLYVCMRKKRIELYSKDALLKVLCYDHGYMVGKPHYNQKQ